MEYLEVVVAHRSGAGEQLPQPVSIHRDDGEVGNVVVIVFRTRLEVLKGCESSLLAPDHRKESLGCTDEAELRLILAEESSQLSVRALLGPIPLLSDMLRVAVGKGRSLAADGTFAPGFMNLRERAVHSRSSELPGAGIRRGLVAARLGNPGPGDLDCRIGLRRARR